MTTQPGRSIFACLMICLSAAAAVNADDKKKVGRLHPWKTNRLIGSPEPPPPYRLERAFPALKFTNPVVLTNAPDTDRLFVVELKGRIVSFPARNDVKKTDLVIDLGKKIKGINQVYGLTFHPEFKRNRYCYIAYVLAANLPEGTRVSRFKVSNTDPPTIDPASEEIVITWLSGGHNGGCLKFGPDGFLYISTGDGGPAFPPDPLKSGQDVGNLRSSILRIDVDRKSNDRLYSIPADNPFVKLDGARGEVWAYGFRNPWKMSFDTATGDLWVGDVGWELWELVYRVEKGGNYGWSLVEGRQPVHRERTRGPTPILKPTAEHSHTEARSMTGGFVYRGERLPKLQGAYVYGDYVTGKMWSLVRSTEGSRIEEIVDTPIQIICFGVDNDQELYVVGYDGTIHRLAANRQREANLEFPKRLSQTGLFASVKEHRLNEGVTGYSINAEPWQDHAVAERFVGVPGDGQLDLWTSTNVQIGYIKDQWKFPENGVLGKTVSLDMERGNPDSRRRLETQILHFQNSGWRAYNYIWNDEQTDAVLSDGSGSVREFEIVDPKAPGGRLKQAWRHASRSECLLCHTTRAGTVHGFNPEQLDMLRDYPDGQANQLDHFHRAGLFAAPPTKPKKPIVSPYDLSAKLEDRGRAYLHVNCGHCHRRGGGGTAAIEVQWGNRLDRTHLLGSRPTQGTFGIHGAEIVAPGDAYRSVLYYRMAKLGRGRMPQFGSALVDHHGLALMRDWIAQLPTAKDAKASGDAARQMRRNSQQLAAGLLLVGEAAKAQPHIDLLTSTPSGSLLAAKLIDDGNLPATVKAKILETAAKLTDPARRDLFERFLPEDQRVKRLGAVINPDDILKLKGDLARGRMLFHKAQGVQCRNCHRVAKEGKQLGPDLDAIGKKYNRAQLLESILAPSKRIEPKFTTYLVETKDGRVLTGLLIRKDEKKVILKDALNKEIEIPASNIERNLPQQKSLMPELQLRDLTAKQVADLLEYLQSLKKEGLGGD